ncbi:MAG: hypothetical protein LBR10_06900, partial [Prevotellaceae bacterium]|nr:hypothetical protein [Prevotellaceae bacterium]
MLSNDGARDITPPWGGSGGLSLVGDNCKQQTRGNDSLSASGLLRLVPANDVTPNVAWGLPRGAWGLPRGAWGLPRGAWGLPRGAWGLPRGAWGL